MKRVIIIDERKERKKAHLSETAQNSLNELVEKNLLCISEGIDGLIDSYLFEYSIIAVHLTYLKENNLYEDVCNYAQKNNKLLLIFSGGITQNMFFNNGQQLNINSYDFYCEKLPNFIIKYCEDDSMEYPLYQLLYGENWELPLLFQYRELCWKYGDLSTAVIDDNDDNDLKEMLMSVFGEPNNNTIEWVISEINKIIKKH